MKDTMSRFSEMNQKPVAGTARVGLHESDSEPLGQVSVCHKSPAGQSRRLAEACTPRLRRLDLHLRTRSGIAILMKVSTT